MRVLEVAVEPGERENLHHHRWPSIMVVLASPGRKSGSFTNSLTFL
jgi:hypothetical protein